LKTKKYITILVYFIALSMIVTGCKDSTGGTLIGTGLPSTEKSENIILFSTTSTFDGALGGRVGADNNCKASGNRPGGFPDTNIRTFISVTSGDEIVNMAANYSIPTDVGIYNSSLTKIEDNWADLINGPESPDNFSSLGVVSGNWWSGTQSSGSILSINNCSNWTAPSSFNGSYGSPFMDNGTGEWIEASSMPGCDDPKYLLCVAF
jgi:hypothetical protein